MNQSTLEPRGEPKDSSQWVRRTVLVTISLGLLAIVGAVFTRVIAARVPEQRATLEKLITDRTGLAVRFDNVHFAWGIDGTSAVFERVELTDPQRGRVRVVAPQLRVEFDTWDFLRHQQFSLGHVTISSPDIDIIGDAEPQAPPARSGKPARVSAGARRIDEDEAAMVRRFTAWAELMPPGRVQVEGARVHLFRRGERKARHDFTLSQAVISRGAGSFNAFGTMLLSQDVGQSLFVSVKLENVGATNGSSGELRVIARRVFIDKLPLLAARGRGTVDARLVLREGRIHDGRWQLSARELVLPGEDRFDHLTVNGSLSRVRNDFLLEFTDLQVTRGARLERSPKLTARLAMAPGTMRPAGVTLLADRVPFMAAELAAAALAPRLEEHRASLPAGWVPTAGELRAVRYDSRAGTFSALLGNVEIMRAADDARVSQLAARLELENGQARLSFDPSSAVNIRLAGMEQPRTVRLGGVLSLREAGLTPTLVFTQFQVQSGDASLSADGGWGLGRLSDAPLKLEMTSVDRALLADAWAVLALEDEFPRLADVQQGRIVTGHMSLQPAVDPAGRRAVDWQRSRGTLELQGVASAGADLPSLADATGKLEFTRRGTQLLLTTGMIEDLRLTGARIDWPRRGAPRLQAALSGDLRSPLLRRALQGQGLERLSGDVSVEAEARGEAALGKPETWRLTAKVSNASIPLASDLPPVERLAGTVRFADGQLRGLALAGHWLGGPVEIESRRAGARGVTSAGINGVADAAQLLKLLGHEDIQQVSGRLAWSGLLQRRAEAAGGAWQATISGNLAGVESRLPEPFDKLRARQVPVSAALRFDERGIHEFEIASGRDVVRGRVDEGVTTARFDVRGISGEWRGADAAAVPRISIDRLDARRTPVVLAAAAALLPAGTELAVSIAELRHASRGLGGVRAALTRRAAGVEFSLESASDSPHELSANGTCGGGEGQCRMEFTVDTEQLTDLLAGAGLPAEWPTRTLRASGELAWRAESAGDITRALTGNFELETQGMDNTHQLLASATLADGQIELVDVQGTGPGPEQIFRGQGRVGLLARTYDLTIDYEEVSLAASAVPTPARARLARAWTVLRGSAARRGWTEATPARRVQWHGSWDQD
jgi:hypothetical protein